MMMMGKMAPPSSSDDARGGRFEAEARALIVETYGADDGLDRSVVATQRNAAGRQHPEGGGRQRVTPAPPPPATPYTDAARRLVARFGLLRPALVSGLRVALCAVATGLKRRREAEGRGSAPPGTCVSEGRGSCGAAAAPRPPLVPLAPKAKAPRTVGDCGRPGWRHRAAAGHALVAVR